MHGNSPVQIDWHLSPEPQYVRTLIGTILTT
jgi:hypothetical protein